MTEPNPNTAPASRKRLFTLEEANKALPLVRMIVSDIVKAWENVSQLEQRLEQVTKRTPRQRQGDVYSEEVTRSQSELQQERTTLQGYLDELDKIGVELKGLDGLCDFPSLHEGRVVYLCWRLGEPSVGHWHELDAGFAGRQPIESIAKPDAVISSLN